MGRRTAGEGGKNNSRRGVTPPLKFSVGLERSVGGGSAEEFGGTFFEVEEES